MQIVIPPKRLFLLGLLVILFNPMPNLCSASEEHEDQRVALNKSLALIKSAGFSITPEDWEELPATIASAPQPGDLLISLVNIGLAEKSRSRQTGYASALDFLTTWLEKSPIRSDLINDSKPYSANQLWSFFRVFPLDPEEIIPYLGQEENEARASVIANAISKELWIGDAGTMHRWMTAVIQELEKKTTVAGKYWCRWLLLEYTGIPHEDETLPQTGTEWKERINGITELDYQTQFKTTALIWKTQHKIDSSIITTFEPLSLKLITYICPIEKTEVAEDGSKKITFRPVEEQPSNKRPVQRLRPVLGCVLPA